MTTGKFKRTAFLTLSILFSGLAAAPAVMAGGANDMEGVWENEEIGVVEIAPCKDNDSKFCGYLQMASPTAIEEFKLRVDKTSRSIQGLMVMSDLTPNAEESKFEDGRFRNTDNSQAQSATLTIKLDGEALNVRASIGWFGEDFKFNRVTEDRQIFASANISPKM
ncbi:MAG: DUF2147 domain-containing protein [Pseudomonadota bacterium]|nr:DUF2147 domain-containing protein [Pseudomonadota bacterium]QKK04430.1 MAG: DUF2147 domain-containing protein [Pseudomonadota bacterium]